MIICRRQRHMIERCTLFAVIFLQRGLPAKAGLLVIIGSKACNHSGTQNTFTPYIQIPLTHYTYVAPKPQRGSKTQNGHFSSEIAICLKKVCYKVSLYENCPRQSIKAFIGLTNPCKNNCWGDPFYLKFWVKLTALERNRRLSIYFRS